MTNCLWVDPVYENLDDISKMLLPYLPRQSSQDFVSAHPSIELTGQDILDEIAKHPDTRWLSIDNILSKKLNKLIKDAQLSNKTPYRLYASSDIEFSLLDMPDKIEIDCESSTINIDRLVCKLELTNAADQIKYRASRLFQDNDIKPTSNDPHTRQHLKKILAIFGKKTRNIKCKHITSEIKDAAINWIREQDVRSVDFLYRFEKEVIRAANGREDAITWLKVLKARSVDKEPIYSMELR